MGNGSGEWSPVFINRGGCIMAEKLFIADKQTLGFPNPTVADESNVMNFLKKIDNGVSISGQKQFKGRHTSSNTSEVIEVLNINGPCNLRHFVVSGSTGNVEININVDGELLVQFRSGTAAPLSNGIVDSSLLFATSTSILTIGTNGNTTAPIIPLTLQDTAMQFDFPFKSTNADMWYLNRHGIKCKKSLIITMRSITTSTIKGYLGIVDL